MTQTVKFYMKGGHVITTTGVKEVTITRELSTGAYSGYSIQWEKGSEPSLFTLSIPEIVAVEATDHLQPTGVLT